MTEGVNTIIFPVKDLAAARALYSSFLGVEPNMDQPYYVNFSIDGQDIGLDPNGHAQGMTGPICFRQVADIEKSLQLLLDAGATPHQAVRNVGGGKLVASVKDPDGNLLGLIQPA